MFLLEMVLNLIRGGQAEARDSFLFQLLECSVPYCACWLEIWDYGGDAYLHEYVNGKIFCLFSLSLPKVVIYCSTHCENKDFNFFLILDVKSDLFLTMEICLEFLLIMTKLIYLEMIWAYSANNLWLTHPLTHILIFVTSMVLFFWFFVFVFRL